MYLSFLISAEVPELSVFFFNTDSVGVKSSDFCDLSKETDAKNGTIKVKVNLSADDAINGEISQFYNEIPQKAIISQRLDIFISNF